MTFKGMDEDFEFAGGAGMTQAEKDEIFDKIDGLQEQIEKLTEAAAKDAERSGTEEGD